MSEQEQRLCECGHRERDHASRFPYGCRSCECVYFRATAQKPQEVAPSDEGLLTAADEVKEIAMRLLDRPDAPDIVTQLHPIVADLQRAQLALIRLGESRDLAALEAKGKP